MHMFPTPLPTKYNESYLQQPYFLWKDCGDDEIVKKFIEIGESTKVVPATTGDGVTTSNLNLQTRNSSLSWLHYNDNKNLELYNFLIDKIDRINFWHFGFQLTGMESIQYTRYPIGGHYMFHNDFIAKKENLVRKISIVMSLSSANDYEGGEFLLMPHGANPTVLKFNRGDLIAFPSYIPHRVNAVTKGHRITIVNWVVGPKFV